MVRRPAAGTRIPSIKDVAAAAQVSVGTVSNVLNRPELVSPATRDRVERTMADLGFVRNESARQLRARTSRRGHGDTDRTRTETPPVRAPYRRRCPGHLGAAQWSTVDAEPRAILGQELARFDSSICLIHSAAACWGVSARDRTWLSMVCVMVSTSVAQAGGTNDGP